MLSRAVERQLAAPISTSCTSPSAGNPCVITSQYDNARDAWNYNETTLTPSNVNSLSVASFSPLQVDNGDLPPGSPSNPIYAQPLYVAGISPSLTNCAAPCNLLLAATLNGTVYAFNTTNGSTVWSRTGKGTSTGPGGNALFYDDCLSGGGPGPGKTNLPFTGIMSTPVIDYNLSPPTMFLTSMCVTQSGAYHWYLHAIDITTGHDVTNSPVDIAGSMNPAANYADDYNAGSVAFVAQREHQRAALLEAPVPGLTGVHPLIYVAFGGGIEEITTGYHGWVFGYDSTNLSQQVVFATTPGSSTSGTPPCCANCQACATSACGGTGQLPCCNQSCIPQNGSGSSFQNSPNWCGHGGGIWMSGRGPAAQNSNNVSHAFSAAVMEDSRPTTETGARASWTSHCNRAVAESASPP